MENNELNRKYRAKNVSKFFFFFAILSFVITHFMGKQEKQIYNIFLMIWFGIDYIIDYINYKFEELKNNNDNRKF